MTIYAMLRDSVMEATRPEEVFGTLTGSSPSEQLANARSTWRNMARTLHPDAGGDEEAFDRLASLWAAATLAIETGTYGTVYAPLAHPIMVRTRRRSFRVTRMVGRGDSCNVYEATYPGVDEVSTDALLKIARSRSDGDLLGNEGRVLKELLSAVDTYDLLSPYLPSYLESFGYRAPGERKARQANAFQAQPRMFSLCDVRRVYPNGINPKDAAWMLRRLLMVLGLTHANGRVHGAVLPEHVLIQPEQHGLVLIDWKYSVSIGDRIKAISAPRRTFYPTEVIAKEPVSPGTDIFMAMQSFAYVLANEPNPIRAFIRGCSQRAQLRRPQDALRLLEEYDDLIVRLWGPRRFRPFAMP